MENRYVPPPQKKKDQEGSEKDMHGGTERNMLGGSCIKYAWGLLKKKYAGTALM